MCSKKRFNELVEDAKKRFKNNPELIRALEETGESVSTESRIKGTIITLNHFEYR